MGFPVSIDSDNDRAFQEGAFFLRKKASLTSSPYHKLML